MKTTSTDRLTAHIRDDLNRLPIFSTHEVVTAIEQNSQHQSELVLTVRDRKEGKTFRVKLTVESW